MNPYSHILTSLHNTISGMNSSSPQPEPTQSNLTTTETQQPTSHVGGLLPNFLLSQGLSAAQGLSPQQSYQLTTPPQYQKMNTFGAGNQQNSSLPPQTIAPHFGTIGGQNSAFSGGNPFLAYLKQMGMSGLGNRIQQQTQGLSPQQQNSANPLAPQPSVLTGNFNSQNITIPQGGQIRSTGISGNMATQKGDLVI